MRKHSSTNTRIVMAAICAALTATWLLPVTANAALTRGAPVEASSHVSSNVRDVPSDAWYADHVYALDRDYDLFHFTTCDEGFCPHEPIKRNIMAVWTVRILDSKEPGSATETQFDDVPTETTQEQYYAGFINRLYELGVTTGCGDGSGFCPDDPVTRAQMAAFLTRAFDLPAGAPHGFDDIPEGAWYSDEVSALKASGITTGCGDNTGFCPKEPTTRAQMAVYLHRALQADLVPPTPAELDSVAEPLERCGLRILPALIGYANGANRYTPIANGETNSCDIIMNWWEAVTQAEADRAEQGQHPCEYESPDSIAWDADLDVYNAEPYGAPLWVQCWPRFEFVTKQALAVKKSDPELYALMLESKSWEIMPPSSLHMLDALWYCYRSVVQGPGPGSPTAMDPHACHWVLTKYGPAVRFAGVEDVCASAMYIARIDEMLTKGGRQLTGNGLYADGYYQGDYSWGNCPTTASRLIPAELADAPYTQRCEAMVDAAADERTDAIAARGGGTRADVIAVVKAIYCEGTNAGIDQNATRLQKYLPENWERDYWRAVEAIYGDDTTDDKSLTNLVGYRSGYGRTCQEAAMLVNAHHAVTQGNPFSKVTYC